MEGKKSAKAGAEKADREKRTNDAILGVGVRVSSFATPIIPRSIPHAIVSQRFPDILGTSQRTR